MIYTERSILVSNNTSKIDSPIILYRGDQNIAIRLKIVNNNFQDAEYGQLIIKGLNKIIAMDITALHNNVLEVTLPGTFMDEVIEVDTYTIQLRLYDESKTSAVTLPEIPQALEIREPIAIKK